MFVDNKIWEELKQAQANVISIREYTDKRRAYDRYYNLFIALVASCGTFGYLFEEKIPLFSSLIIALVSLIKAIFPHIIQPEQELCKLDSIMDYYNNFLVKLEHIYYQLCNQIISEQEAETLIYNLKLEECEKQSVLNKLQRSISNKQKEKNNQEAERYLLEVYYNRYERDNNTNNDEQGTTCTTNVKVSGSTVKGDNPTPINASTTSAKSKIKKRTKKHGR